MTFPEAPPLRLSAVNDAPLRPDGRHVLYWMIAARRTRWSFGLQHAIARAQQLGRPLLVLEPLRADYRWASDRHHRFVLDGMAAQRDRFAATPVAYHPYVEPHPGAGRGLLEALAADACLVVTDTSPGLSLPRMVAAAGRRLAVRLEAVDGNGLLPLDASDRAYPTAHAFRRFVQGALPAHLGEQPLADPLAAAALPRASIPEAIATRWPAPPLAALTGADSAWLAALPIDHGVAPVALRGGEVAAGARLAGFLAGPLARYCEDRNEPDRDGSSGLSPYLHFGHVAAAEVVAGVLTRERWDASQLAPKATGSRAGWWGLSPPAEAFLDQIITWRELGYGFAHHRPDDHEDYRALPPWALTTLEEHASDPRPVRYDLAALDAAATHDPLWNAAQRQLRRDGTIHNYLRMLWGKKVLHWSASPERALAILLELNNRYALDGRDPNSTSGIFWCLGRFDRAWGPERPIFGKVRYMTSESTARKMSVKGYLARFGP